MKVLLINGSPHNDGCGKRALDEINSELKKEGIEGIYFNIDKDVAGCIDCLYCAKNKKCFRDDCVNKLSSIIDEIDGIVVSAPVYYASPNGSVLSFLDRMFRIYSPKLRFKPACAIATARRAGTTASIDIINKYFAINNMPIVTSCYWNMVHGNNKEEADCDLEGLQVMRGLGRNMAWMIKLIENGKKNGIDYPIVEQKIKTNFTR